MPKGLLKSHYGPGVYYDCALCFAVVCRCVRVSVRVCMNIYTTPTYVYISVYVSPFPLSAPSMAKLCQTVVGKYQSSVMLSWGWGGGTDGLGENKHILPSLHTVLIAWPNDFLIANQFQQLANQHDPAIVAN